MASTVFKTKAKHPTDAVFGKKTDGSLLIFPIAKTPHLLVAGQTGSGKSVFLNQILISIMTHTHPNEIQLAWIDPKKVEAEPYIDSPYCITNPVKEIGDAYAFLGWACYEMDKRYETLSKAGVKNIDSYLEFIDKNSEQAKELNLEKMPFLIIIIDEFSDLIMQIPDIEDFVIRLAQKARAAGIHLIIATQRPDAATVTPKIRDNIPGRIGLLVVNTQASNIILGQDGCELLRGYGDGLIKLDNKITRCQGPFISDKELYSIMEFLKNQYEPQPFLDYKQKAVDLGIVEWETEYDESVPWEDRHVKKAARRRR